MLATTDLGHTIMVLASNLLLQIVFYAYFRSLMIQLEEPSYSYLQQQHPDQMTVAQAEAFISANVAKLIEIQFKTDAYSSLNQDEEDVLTCSICLQDFGQSDRVTRLNCNHKHMFHESCL